jgi:transposase
MLFEQIKTVEAERDALIAAEKETISPPTPAAMLLNIRGIGAEFAAILWPEGQFRRFNNRRQIAAYAGLAPSPWQSGSVDRQPKSALALWFEERVKESGRLRKTTIVALARKLLIALWKYVTLGVVIEGAGAPSRARKPASLFSALRNVGLKV